MRKFLVIGCLLGFLGCFGLAQEPQHPWIDRLVEIKEKEMHAMAKQLDLEVLPLFTNSFKQVRERNWKAACTQQIAFFKQLDRPSQKGGTIPVTPVVSGPIVELIGTLQMLHPDAHPQKGNDFLPADAIGFGREILATMPQGAIYFGGTDPGRFLVQSAYDLDPDKKISIMSQNAISDVNQLGVIRARFGERLVMPDELQIAEAFRVFDDDVTIGRYWPSGSGERDPKTGRIQVDGLQDLMYVNGLIVRQILEQNPGCAVFIEESYRMDWMAPHLEPHGMILKVHAEPTPLTEEKADAAIAYWQKKVPELLANPAPPASALRKTWAKLCGGQVGVLEHHGYSERALTLYDLGLKIFESPELLTRKLSLLIATEDFDRAHKTLDKAPEDLFNQKPWRTALKALGGIQRQMDARQAALELLEGRRLRAGVALTGELTSALHLSGEARIDVFLKFIMNQADAGLAFPEIYKSMERLDRNAPAARARMRRAVDLYLMTQPTAVDAHFYDAILSLREGRKEASWAAVEQTLRLGKDNPATEMRLRGEAATRLRPLFSEAGRFDGLLKKIRSEK